MQAQFSAPSQQEQTAKARKHRKKGDPEKEPLVNAPARHNMPGTSPKESVGGQSSATNFDETSRSTSINEPPLDYDSDAYHKSEGSW